MLKDKNYYEGLDKRTREYIAYAKFNKLSNDVINTKGLGLGDVIESITEATGIKKVVKAIFGDDCGFDERKDKMNHKFPIKRKPQRCLTKDFYNSYKEYVDRRSLNVWNQIDIDVLIDTYAHVFAIQYHSKDLCRSCAGSAKILFNISKELDIVFYTYEKDMQDLKTK
jgi:hypothetical protein